jgi:D-alanine-D-alanine ligase
MAKGIWKGKKIGVLMGGFSRERDISLKSGRAMFQALVKLGYDVIDVDVDTQVSERLHKEKIDVAAIALHGPYGEDGAIQGLLECLKIPYTGSGVTASAICLDKDITRTLVQLQGVTVPQGVTLTRKQDLATVKKNIMSLLPVVVKPAHEGSTIGIHIVKTGDSLQPSVQEALTLDTKVVIERYIEGTEITVGLVNGRALTPLEIVPHSGFYDFKAKYTPGQTEYIVPARISKKMTQLVQAQSEAMFSTLGLKGVARTDFIISNDETAYFLEVNTIPGMTETSLVPKAAQHDGINFEELMEEILDSASLEGGS